MRRWKRIVAILLIATLAFVVEGWISSAQGAPLLFKSTASPGYRFAPELTGKETYPRGTVALGNVDGGNSARFFLVHKGSKLPAKYTVIGKVTGGLDVLDKIVARPGAPVWITAVQIG